MLVAGGRRAASRDGAMRECGALLARATGDMRHVIGLGRIHKMVIRRIHELDTYQDAYPFFLINKNRILIGYVSDVYQIRIHIRYTIRVFSQVSVQRREKT